MFKYFLFSFLLLLPAVIQAQHDSFVMMGEIDGTYTGNVILHYTLNDHVLLSDTVAVRNNTFRFAGALPYPVQAVLELEGLSTPVWVYLDSGLINVKTHADVFTDNQGRQVHDFQLISVSGSHSEKQRSDFFTFWRALVASDRTDTEKSDLLYQRMLALVDAQPHSNLGSDLLRDADMLTAQQARTIYSHLSKEQQALAESNGVKKLLNRLDRTDAGKPFHFIALPDTTGRPVSGERLPHRYILIDFWASWCGPCRRENANLVFLYNQYHKRGFEILGISLDDDRQAWTRAIVHDQLPWPQVSDLAGTNNAAFQYYNLSFVPFNVLLNEQGIIIAKNLTGKKLEERLTALLGK